VIQLDDNVFVFNGNENPAISAAAGADVTFEISNIGDALHNVHVAASGSYAQSFCSALGDDPCSDPARISDGDAGSITFNLPAGSYDFRCDFHTSEMTGTFEVQ
jgi:plastocyanin